jgi:hypothetical protein
MKIEKILKIVWIDTRELSPVSRKSVAEKQSLDHITINDVYGSTICDHDIVILRYKNLRKIIKSKY